MLSTWRYVGVVPLTLVSPLVHAQSIEPVNSFHGRYFPDTGGIERVTLGNPRSVRLTFFRDF